MNVLVTAGGTRAPIDDVRAITNTSTGRFGASIAEAALARGADVWYLHPPNALRPFHQSSRFQLDAPDIASEFARLAALRDRWLATRDRCQLVSLPTGSFTEYSEVFRRLVTDHGFDLIFLAMAASDYAPTAEAGKLPSDADELVIRCQRLPKLIANARDLAPNSYIIGFKLGSNLATADLIARAEAATRTNRVDLTVANDLATVQAGQHTIHLVRPGHPVETYGPAGSIAEKLVERATNWFREKSREPLRADPRHH